MAPVLGVTPTEADALAYLAAAGRLSKAELGRDLDLSEGGTIALEQRVEARGHVARVPRADGRPEALLVLTASARAQLANRESLAARLDGLAARLSEEHHRAIAEFLTDAVQLTLAAARDADT